MYESYVMIRFSITSFKSRFSRFISTPLYSSALISSRLRIRSNPSFTTMFNFSRYSFCSSLNPEEVRYKRLVSANIRLSGAFRSCETTLIILFFSSLSSFRLRIWSLSILFRSSMALAFSLIRSALFLSSLFTTRF